MIRIIRRLLAGLGIIIGLVVLGVVAALAYFFISVRTGVASVDGTRSGLAVNAPVSILRDERGIPHIRARNDHDLFFAQGYVTGSDRLFQIDITRRFVLGRLSEVLGSPLIEVDMQHRILDVRATVAKQFAHLNSAQQEELQAYADGVNAAATHEPLPPEYHTLAFSFEPWRAQDALITGFATVLDLADRWSDVIERDTVLASAGPHAVDALFSLTDPMYDTPTVGGAHVVLPPLPPIHGYLSQRVPAWDGEIRHDVFGSNEWAAGAARTTTGRALLANDPHLDRGVPGIWQLVDLQSPQLHAGGATLAGVPGVILGHNERVAWGSTNGTVSSMRVYAEHFVSDDGTGYVRAGTSNGTATERTETFHVRFGADRTRRYLSTEHGFVVENTGSIRHAVQWGAAIAPRSPVEAFLVLDRAGSIEDALRALSTYPGPTQNFVLADVTGRVAYSLAGEIPNDGIWGLHAQDGSTDGATPLQPVAFAQLPHVAASRSAVVNNSNNLQYAAGYPYRLSSDYSAPYRAAEIRHRLDALPRYSVSDFVSIQADTVSIADIELARRCVDALTHTGASSEPALAPAFAALRDFDGHFNPSSRGATVVQRVRGIAVRDLLSGIIPQPGLRAYFATGPGVVTLMRALRERPSGWFRNDDPDAFLTNVVREAAAQFGRDALATPYGDAYAVTARHPLSAFGIHGWDGPRVPGSGGAYAPAVQGASLGQSFRAVWDVGAWDAGGIDIPIGESGEPGSPHYRDLAAAYPRHALTPLPFSAAAVAAATRHTLVLSP
jgi:penicillin G amidase